MSTELADVSTMEVEKKLAPEHTAHALHIKDLPHEVWCRARNNANLSGLPYRDYVIRLLSECQPFPRQTNGPGTK